MSPTSYQAAPPRAMNIADDRDCVKLADSGGGRPSPASALVCLDLARLDSDAQPTSAANTAYYLARLRHRDRIGSLAALPAHCSGNVARNACRCPTLTRAFFAQDSRRDCLSRPAGMVGDRLRSDGLRWHSRYLPVPLSSPLRPWSVVNQAVQQSALTFAPSCATLRVKSP